MAIDVKRHVESSANWALQLGGASWAHGSDGIPSYQAGKKERSAALSYEEMAYLRQVGL